MYRLRIIAGPNRGESYDLGDGAETSIGRQVGNTIVLPSTKISKKHCVLVVSNGEVVVQDQGSSNGTFVNGVLAQKKQIRPGDRISIGEYILELVKGSRSSRNQLQLVSPLDILTNNVIPLPSQDGAGFSPGGPATDGPIGATIAPEKPQDILGKISWNFENYVMPALYSVMYKTEWRIAGFGVFAAFVVANLFIAIQPLLNQGRSSLVQEVARRAQLMARQIADRNAPLLASGAELKTDIGGFEKEDGVRMALLMDLDSRIIAPASKMNAYLSQGTEAQVAVRARNEFRKGRERGFAQEIGDSALVAIEPIKVFVPQAARNMVVGMALVSMDTSLAVPDWGELCMTYSQTFIFTAVLALLTLWLLYRMTLKPLEALNDDLDKALKGELNQVTHEFQFEELDALWNNVNTAIQRIPKRGSSASAGGSSGPTLEDFLPSLRLLGDLSKFGLAVCDGERRVTYMNPLFEEITGIRASHAAGQELASVASDQAFGAFANDLFDRAHSSASGTSQDFEFSGIRYKIFAIALGASSGPAKGYAMVASRDEG